MPRNSLLLVSIWLACIAVLSGGAAYAQFCYSSGPNAYYPQVSCAWINDTQCSQYGENITCELQRCEMYPCQWANKAQCVDEWYVCSTDRCGDWWCT